MPEFKMNWQQILEAARAGLASAKSGNFSSGSTLPPEQPPPQVTQTPPPQQPVPQSLFDAYAAKYQPKTLEPAQFPPVPTPRPVGGPPESLSSPDAYPGQLDMPPRMDPARLYPSLPAHMPPYNLTPDHPGNLFNAFGDPSLAPGPNTGVPLHQRMTAGGRRYDYIDDKRGTSRHEAVVAMLEKLMKEMGISHDTSAIHRRGR